MYAGKEGEHVMTCTVLCILRESFAVYAGKEGEHVTMCTVLCILRESFAVYAGKEGENVMMCTVLCILRESFAVYAGKEGENVMMCTVLCILRESFAVYAGKEEGSRPRPRAVLAKVASFSCLWTFTCYVFLRALMLKKYFYIDVIALLASLSAFVFVMAWIILQRQFMAMRVKTLLMFFVCCGRG